MENIYSLNKGIEVQYTEGGRWYTVTYIDLQGVVAIKFPDGMIYDFILAQRGLAPWRNIINPFGSTEWANK